MKEEVREFFNQTEIYLDRPFGVRLRAEIIREFVGGLEGKNILDAGCGDGGITLQFLDKNKITFCDLAENMLSKVANQIPDNRKSNTVLVNSAIETFTSEHKFDYIFCVGVLAHVPSVEGCIKHLTGLLSDNGKLIIQFSNYNHWLTRLSISLASIDYSVNKLIENELLALMSRENMSVEKEVQYNFMFPGFGKLPDSFLYSMQRLTWRLKFLRVIGTDYIWLLKRNK